MQICYTIDMNIFARVKRKLKIAQIKRRCKIADLSFPIFCKTHGVKNVLYQGALAQTRTGDRLQIVHVPLREYPHNVYVYSIPLNRILGYLQKELAERLVYAFGGNFCLDAVVENRTGGTEPHPIFGCNLRLFHTRQMLVDVKDFSHLYSL